MVKEVRSPHNATRDQYHPQRGISPGAYSSPSNAARSDGGHLAHNIGKGGSMPAARRDSTPVVGESGNAARLEQALERGMRGDQR
jgi:hypothetical protein